MNIINAITTRENYIYVFKGVQHPWALFWKLCLFSPKNKAALDKITKSFLRSDPTFSGTHIKKYFSFFQEPCSLCSTLKFLKGTEIFLYVSTRKFWIWSQKIFNNYVIEQSWWTYICWTLDKVSYRSGQECSKKLKYHGFTSIETIAVKLQWKICENQYFPCFEP